MATTTTTTSKKQDTINKDTFYYIGVEGVPGEDECMVYGLSPKEESAILRRFPRSLFYPYSAVGLKGAVISVINALAELGYRVHVCNTMNSKLYWTMERN